MKKYPNIELLGACYDVAKLNPFNLCEFIEQGGGLTDHSAIKFKRFVPVADESFEVPACTGYMPQHSAKLAETSVMMASQYDFQHHFGVSVDVGAGFAGIVAFSASAAYNEFKRKTGSHKQVQTHVEAKYEDCRINFLPDKKDDYDLDEYFLKSVSELEDNEESYKDFIAKFGTHYSREIIYGGRMYQSIMMESSAIRNLVSTKMNIGASVMFTFGACTAHASTKVEEGDVKDLRDEHGCKVENVTWIGGTPNTDFNLWAKTISENPQAVQVSFTPLYELLTNEHFTNPNIDKKREGLKAAVHKYLKSMETDFSLEYGSTVAIESSYVSAIKLSADGMKVFMGPDYGEIGKEQKWRIIKLEEGKAIREGKVRIGDQVYFELAEWNPAIRLVENQFNHNIQLSREEMIPPTAIWKLQSAKEYIQETGNQLHIGERIYLETVNTEKSYLTCIGILMTSPKMYESVWELVPAT